MRGTLIAAIVAMIVGATHAADNAAALSPAQAPALAAQGRRLLWLRSGVVDVAASKNALTLEAFEPGWHVLMLDGPMTSERRAALEGAGVRVGDYLPTNSFLADVSKATPAAVWKVGFVVWAGRYEKAWRLDPMLLAPDRRAWKEPARAVVRKSGQRFVSIWHFAGAPVRPTLDALSKIKDARVLWQESVAGGEVVWATVPHRSVASLAALEDVQFIDEVGEYATRSTSTTRWVVQTNVANLTPLYTMGITGVGQLVNINDDPVGIQNCALLDAVNPIGPTHRKIEAYAGTPTYTRHGTMVSAILLGDAGVNDDTRGIAYGARMTYGALPFLNEPSITTLFSQQYDLGTRLSNNSWGDDGTTAYNAVCRALDAFSFTHDDQLMVFAISNLPTIRNPENAKSILAVGNSFNAPAQENMCGGGVGLTSDGRLKPEITAPGCNILASASVTGCATQSDTGTSFATPAVTGAATLARQYFMGGFYPTGVAMPGDAFTPTGTLLKALVLNSAQDMTGVTGYPDATEGWGRVEITASLNVAGGTRRVVVRDQPNASSTLGTGDTVETFVAVRNSAEPLRVTLAFFDAPAAVNATFAPVNDLDLQVISPGGAVYRGDVFAAGVSALGGSADAINSVEQVKIVNPTPGRWRVRVLASAINQGPQGFALTTSGVVDDVPCATDLDDGTGTGQPDGGVDINDLLYFLAQFEQGQASVDLDNGSGLGRPDGGVDINDLLYFLVRFEGGC